MHIRLHIFFVRIFVVIGLISFNSKVAAQDNGQVGQDANHRKFISEIEAFIGPSVSWGGSHVENQVPYYSYVFGGGISHRICNAFEINSRISLDRKGSKTEYISTFYDQNNVGTTSQFIQGTKLDYLTATLIIKYYLGEHQKFYTGLGGYYSNARKMKNYTEEYTLQGDLVSYYYADIVDYKNLDYGLSGSLGFKTKLRGNLGFGVQLLGNMGLPDLFRTEFNNTYSVRNVFISLVVIITLNPG